MTRKVIVRSQSANCHRGQAVGEIAGNAAAECAAVCCCFPCAVLNFVVLAVYTVPAGLVRKAVNKKRRRLRNKNVVVGDKKNDVVLLPLQRSSSMVEIDIAVGPTLLEYLSKESSEKSEVVALEEEMWARFAGTGFWRSESQREP